MITKQMIDWWKTNPVTVKLLQELQEKRHELVESLVKGEAFGTPDPLLHAYRTVGVLRLIDEILNDELLEVVRGEPPTMGERLND